MDGLGFYVRMGGLTWVVLVLAWPLPCPECGGSLERWADGHEPACRTPGPPVLAPMLAVALCGRPAATRQPWVFSVLRPPMGLEGGFQ